jgi:hypothetical protein
MTEDEELHQPHDKLFIQGFSTPANAAALLSTQCNAMSLAQVHRQEGSVQMSLRHVSSRCWRRGLPALAH